MPIEPLTAAEQAELRRLNRKFIADIEAVVRGPVGCMQSEAEVEAGVRDIVTAICMGMADAAADFVIEGGDST